MSKKAVVLVTRKLPDAVEARLERDYDARFNSADKVYASDELVEFAAGADASSLPHREAYRGGY